MKILITGGSGAIAQHLIAYFQKHGGVPTNTMEASDKLEIDTIITVDRKPELNIDLIGRRNENQEIPVIHKQLDIVKQQAELCEVLKEEKVDLVVHLCRKQFEFLQSKDQHELDKEYWRDNYQATEVLLKAMSQSLVSKLVYIGDAYANLPAGDNFGSSEDVHTGICTGKLLLGEYGRSRTDAELAARSMVGRQLENGTIFCALFLRPTVIYGEGLTKLPEAIITVARSHAGKISISEGPSNGMLQFIYAGNLAGFIANSIALLTDSQSQYSGEYLYVMDTSLCTKFSKFCKPIVEEFGYEIEESKGAFYFLLFKHYINKLSQNKREFSTMAFQFVNAYCLGFNNKKQQLILQFQPEPTGKNLRRTIHWLQKWLN